MNWLLLAIILAVSIGSFFAIKQAGAAPSQHTEPADNIISLNFDLDGNVMNLPTMIVVFHRETDEEVHVDVHEFRHGTEPWHAYYDMRSADDPALGSFRYTDTHDQNYYLESVERFLQNPTVDHFGPEYVRFYYALKNPHTRRWLSIITARGHLPEQMHEGHLRLHQTGLIPSAPEEQGLYPVSYLYGPATKFKTTDAKVLVLRERLDAVQRVGFTEKTRPIISRSGHGTERLHYFEFSDDTVENIEAALEKISKQVRAGRWANVKIGFVYSGRRFPRIQNHRMVITPEGGVRAMTEPEQHEIDALIGVEEHAVDRLGFCERLLRGV